MLEPLRQLTTPGTVAVALGAVGIIALIHWLARDRTPPIILPTARFIPSNDSSAITRHWRDAMMYAWRSMFALLCIAAIALWLLPQPPTPGGSDTAAPDSRIPLVIVLDGSGSMREPLANGTRFDAARAAAVQAIQQAATCDQSIMLIVAQRLNRAISPLLSTDASASLDALNAFEPNDAHADLARAVEHAVEQLDALRIERADLLLLTDGQRAAAEVLADLDAGLRARWRSIEAQVFNEPRTDPRLWWIAEDPAEVPAFTQRITLGIDNPSDDPRTVTLTLRTTLGTDRQRLILAPNETQTLTIPIAPTEPGPWEAAATLDSTPDAPLLIVGDTPDPTEVLLLDAAAQRYAEALDPRDPDEQLSTHWPLRLASSPITPSPVVRHSMPHEKPAIHIARPSTAFSNSTPHTPQLLLADSAAEIELIAQQLSIEIPTVSQPRATELATPTRAAGLALNTHVPANWWARSLNNATIAATDDLGRPLALRTSMNGSPTIILLGEPDRRDVRLPLLLLELLAPLAPPQPETAGTIIAGRSATMLLEPPATQQFPLQLIGPNDQKLPITIAPTTTSTPGTNLLRLTTPPLDHAGLWRIESSDGQRLASIAAAPNPKELNAIFVDAATLRAWLGGTDSASASSAPTSARNPQTAGPEAASPSWLPMMLLIIALVMLVSEPLLGRLLGDVAKALSAITALRLIAALLLLATAWLAWQRPSAEPINGAPPAPAPSADRPTLHILLDRSESMRGIRQTNAEAWLRRARTDDLATRAEVRIIPFPDAPPPDRSPLLDAIDATLAEAMPGDAIIVLSDGADTTADPLARTTRAERLAQQAAARGIPIHAAPLDGGGVGYGYALHASVAIEPTPITPGEPALARIAVHAINTGDPLDRDVPTRVRVTAASPALGDPAAWPNQRELLDATLPVPPGGLSFELPIAPETGQRWLAVHVAAEADALIPPDPLIDLPARTASALAIARIDREPRRILLLEGNPAPATRRTIQALARTPGLVVEAAQSLGPRIDFTRWRLDPNDPANLQRTTNLPWPSPVNGATPNELDLIILGNRLDRLLTPSEAAAIADRIIQGTPAVRLNPPPLDPALDEAPTATGAILAEALADAPPEPLFVDDRLGLGDDRWIGAFIAQQIGQGIAADPIQLLTPARPVRPGEAVTIGVLLADPEAAPPRLRYTPLESNDAGGDPMADRAIPLTPSPSTPGLWLARLPGDASVPTLNIPAARPFRLIAETTTAAAQSHAAEAWLSVDARSPEAARGLGATDHALLSVTAKQSGGVFFLRAEDVVELFAPFREQLDANAGANGARESPWFQGMIWLVLSLLALAALLIALWTARRWRGLA